MPEYKYSFAPVVDEGCTVLVLGSLPGDASLRQAEYYAHPRNAFWRIMGQLCGFAADRPYQERLACINRAGIALWDVVYAGVREGSSDAHICREIPNDIAGLLREHPSIGTICCNGGCSWRYLKRYYPALWGRGGCQVHQLPSTSPAAARLSFEDKLAAYAAVLSPLLRHEAVGQPS